jgi:hypothetical protein
LAARGDIKSSTSGIIVGGLVGGLGLVLTFAHANQASWEHVSKVIYENQRHFHSDPFYVTTTNPLRIEAAAGFEYAFGTEFSRAGSTTIGVLILFTACFALWKSRPQATIPEHAASTRSALLILTVFLCIYHQLPEYLLPIVPLVACLSCAHSSWRILPPILRVAFSLLLLVPFVNVSQTHSFQRFFAAVFSSAIHEGSSLEFFSRLASSANSLSVFIAWLILTFYLLFRSQAGFERNQMV